MSSRGRALCERRRLHRRGSVIIDNMCVLFGPATCATAELISSSHLPLAVQFAVRTGREADEQSARAPSICSRDAACSARNSHVRSRSPKAAHLVPAQPHAHTLGAADLTIP